MLDVTQLDPEQRRPIRRAEYHAMGIVGLFEGAADDYSEPDPDVAVVSKAEPRSDHPARAHLLIEVSASSLRFDRSAKAAIYARAGVPAYFIVNLEARCIEAYLTPGGGRYTEDRTYRGGEPIEVPGFPDVTFSADELFEV